MCHFIAAVLFHLDSKKITISRSTAAVSAHTEIFLVMGRGVWDHKSRSYLSTPCLDPRGAPFLLSNNFYNPICGHVCPGRPAGRAGTMQRCQPNNQPNNGIAPPPQRSPQVCVHVRLKVVSSCVRQAIKICEKHKMHSGATLFMW